MNFKEFEEKLLYEIENKKKECFKTLKENEKLIQTYLVPSEKSSHLKEFVSQLNDIILKKTKRFDLIENVLNHPLFSNVLSYFRESDILIKACIHKNIKAIKWLFTMEIDKTVQDERGMTALMHATLHNDLYFVVEHLAGFDDELNEITDSKGDTALFYAVPNVKSFNKLIRRNMNINHCRKDGDSLLIYCIKFHYIDSLTYLLYHRNLDVNYVNEEGRTALFYLFEYEQYDQFRLLLKNFKGVVNTNYATKNGETILHLFFKRYYEFWTTNEIRVLTDEEKLKWITNLDELIDAGCDINGAIDDLGNTPIMFFIMTDNLIALDYYLCKFSIDLSKKNVYGVNATYLIVEKERYLDDIYKKCSLAIDHPKSNVIKQPTFDYGFRDEKHNTLLMHAIIRDEPYYYFILEKVYENEKIMNAINYQKETALIMAVKLGRHNFLNRNLITHSPIDYQDEKGNTALHYAVELKDKYAINILVYYHANIKIENNEGMNPLDLALKSSVEEDDDNDEAIQREDIINIINSPISPDKMLQKIKNENKTLGIFNKKKTTDEKVNDYIEKYRKDIYYNQYKTNIIDDTNLLETQYKYKTKSKFYECILNVCKYIYYPEKKNKSVYI